MEIFSYEVTWAAIFLQPHELKVNELHALKLIEQTEYLQVTLHISFFNIRINCANFNKLGAAPGYWLE